MNLFKLRRDSIKSQEITQNIRGKNFKKKNKYMQGHNEKFTDIDILPNTDVACIKKNQSNNCRNKHILRQIV